jgi:opacity protein-like surface antigen
MPSHSPRIALVVLALLAVDSLLSREARGAPATEARPAHPVYARANRLAVQFGFGFGSASLSQFHQGVDELTSNIERTNHLKLSASPQSSLQINAELAMRYYFAYHILAQVGYGALYNHASAEFPAGSITGTVSNHNLVMEVPILVGGYYCLIDRLYLYGAAGPAPFFFARSYWDANPGGISDFKADGGGGFHGLAGADFMLAEQVAIGLEVRYRLLKTGALNELKYGQLLTSGMLRGDNSTETYSMDFSGVSLGLNLRIFAL